MLTQAEADALIAMPKVFRNGNQTLPIHPGVDYHCDVDSQDGTERFILDVRRKGIRLTKYRYQTRARKILVLVRLDIAGPPHTNPDGVTLGGSHLHVYRDGYDDKWAIEVPTGDFTNTSDPALTLVQFCAYVNIQHNVLVAAQLGIARP